MNNFNSIIQPLQPNDFFENYWEKNYLVISRNDPDYYSGLFSLQELSTLVWSTKPSWGHIQLANSNRKEGWVDYTSQPPTIERLTKAYMQGDTIVLNDLQLQSKPIALLCRSFEALFNFVVNVNMYLTPKDAQGLAPHFDTQNVFILQIQGSKNWCLYDSWIKQPLDEMSQALPLDYISKTFTNVKLQAGDMLYIPRGVVHEALTTDESSMHLTIGVSILSFRTLLESILQLASHQDVDFRSALPIGFANNKEILPSLHNKVESLLKQLLANFNIEEAVERLGQRVMETMQVLPDDLYFQIPEVDTLNLKTVLRKREGMFCQVFRERDLVKLQLPGGYAVSGPQILESAFHFVANSDTFAISELPNSLTENAKVVLARRLIKEGLLTIVSSKTQQTEALALVSNSSLLT